MYISKYWVARARTGWKEKTYQRLRILVDRHVHFWECQLVEVVDKPSETETICMHQAIFFNGALGLSYHFVL